MDNKVKWSVTVSSVIVHLSVTSEFDTIKDWSPGWPKFCAGVNLANRKSTEQLIFLGNVEILPYILGLPCFFTPSLRWPVPSNTHACGHQVHILHTAGSCAHLLPLGHPLVRQCLSPHNNEGHVANLFRPELGQALIFCSHPGTCSVTTWPGLGLGVPVNF